VHGANSYQLQPYTGFNALRVAAAATGTLTLATPTTLATARLIGFATEGTQTVNLQLNFQDGSFASYNGVTLRDWFNGASAVASGFGRAGRTGDVITNPAGNPRIYSLEMAVACTDQTKPITSIAITSTASAGSTPAAYLLGLSGASGVTAPITGNANVVVGEVTALASASAGGTWISSDPAVATVSATGVVTALAAGTTTIRYTVATLCGAPPPELLLTVAPASTTTTVTPPAPGQTGQAASFAVSVAVDAPGAGVPNGTVNVQVGADSCTATLVGGAGSCTLTPSAPGTLPVVAAYSGATGYGSSTARANWLVANPAGPVPVPTLQAGALAGLSVAMALAGWGRRRRNRR
jgi:hypothetical protein